MHSEGRREPKEGRDVAPETEQVGQRRDVEIYKVHNKVGSLG